MKIQPIQLRLKKIGAFTLVELMVALAVIGITAIVVLPQMGQMTQANKMTEYINLLSRDINYARSEAVSRGENVSIRSINGVDWTRGWFIQVDSNAGFANAIRQYGPGDGTQIIKGPAFVETSNLLSGGTAGVVTFRPNGSVDNAASFGLCDNTDANSKLYGKQLSLGSTGRIQIASKNDPSTGLQICP